MIHDLVLRPTPPVLLHKKPTVARDVSRHTEIAQLEPPAVLSLDPHHVVRLDVEVHNTEGVEFLDSRQYLPAYPEDLNRRQAPDLRLLARPLRSRRDFFDGMKRLGPAQWPRCDTEMVGERLNCSLL